MQTPLLALGLFIAQTLLLLASVCAQERTAPVDTERSVLAYTGRHPLHSWTGTSRQLTGSITLDPARPYRAQVVLRVPVQSFDSDNGKRDAKMLDVTEAAVYPAAVFTSASVTAETWKQTHDGYEGTWRLRGPLSFHGQTHDVEIPAHVRLVEGLFEAEAAFAVSLRQFRIDRPRLFFVPIEEHITLEGTIRATLPVSTARH